MGIIKKRHVLLYALAGLILLLTFFFQRDLDHTQTLSAETVLLEEESGQEETVFSVKPGLLLKSGTYTVELGTYVKGTTDDARVQFYSDEKGVLLEAAFSDGIQVNSYQLNLSDRETIVNIKLMTEADKPVEVYQVTVRGEKPLYTDTAWFLLLFAVCWILCGFYFFGRRGEKRLDYSILILGLGVFMASYPLLSDYLIEGHDLNFQLYRIEGIKDGLLAGQFPVRIHPTHNSGYGYATPVMYPELFLYIPALLRILGVSVVASFQVFLIGINCLTAWIAYYSVKDVTKSKETATLFSFIYVVSSYRVACVLQRNAVGEILALCFMPLVIAGLYHLILGDKRKWYQLVIGATGIFQSHMIGTLFALLLALFICLTNLPRLFHNKRWVGAVKAVVLLVLINLWYIVPFLDFISLDLNLNHTSDGLGIFYNNAVYVPQLFNLLADEFGYSHNLDGGMGGELSQTMGLIVTGIFLPLILWYLILKKDWKRFSFKLFLFGCLALLASTTLIPWQRLQGIGFINYLTSIIQFPWRFLGLASAAFVFAGAMVYRKWEPVLSVKARKGIMVGTVAVGVVMLTIFGSRTTQMDVYLRKAQAIDLTSTIGMNNEYLLYGTDTALLTGGRYECSEGVKVSDADKNGTTIRLAYESTKDGYVEVPLLWYPGYSAKTEDGRKLSVTEGTNHVLRVELPGGESGKVTVYYAGKTIYHVAEIVSAITLAGWLGIVIVKKRRRLLLKDETKK